MKSRHTFMALGLAFIMSFLSQEPWKKEKANSGIEASTPQQGGEAQSQSLVKEAKLSRNSGFDGTSPGRHQVYVIKSASSDPLRIPPVTGDWSSMWGRLKETKDLYIPFFGMDSLSNILDSKEYGTVKWSDMKQEYLYVKLPMQGKEASLFAIFSDPTYILPHISFEPADPEKLLRFVVFDENSDGVMFNPTSEHTKSGIDGYGLNKAGVAELVGYLHAAQLQYGESHYQKAIQAFDDKDYYRVLYHWGQSYRAKSSDEKWVECEIAKLQSLWELNFPGSRERAKSELKWFEDNHGASEASRALHARFENVDG